MKKLVSLFVLVLTVCSCGKTNNSKEVVFRIANGAEPESLDPAKTQGAPTHRVLLALCEGLMTYNPQTADPEPGMAESLPQISDDGRTYTFTLRENIKWSDGEPVTAGDFEFSIKRMLDPKTAAPYANLLYMIEGGEEFNTGKGTKDDVQVKALDDRTLQITLKNQTAYFTSLVAHYAFMPVPRHVVEKYGDEWTSVKNYVSNGPFILDEVVMNSHVSVHKNPLYYDIDSVKLDRVIFYTTDDDTTAYNMYRQGEVDWNVHVFPASLVDEVRLRDDAHNNIQMGNMCYAFNMTKKPMSDVRVRQALAMALNRQELVDKVLKDGSPVSPRFVSKMEGYPAIKGTEYNVAMAQKLLAEAGYPDGKNFPTIELLYNTNDRHRVVAEWAQAQWKENLGINVTLHNEEWKVFLDSRTQAHFDISRNGWISDFKDPISFLEIFLSTCPMNGGRYNSSLYDQLIHKAQTMPNGPERFNLMAEAERVLVEKDQALIPLCDQNYIHLIDLNKWGGWAPNVLDIHPPKCIYRK